MLVNALAQEKILAVDQEYKIKPEAVQMEQKKSVPSLIQREQLLAIGQTVLCRIAKVTLTFICLELSFDKKVTYTSEFD